MTRLNRNWVLCLLVAASPGAAWATTEGPLCWRSEAAAQAPERDEVVTADAISGSNWGQPRVTLRFINWGTAPVPMSFAVDQYVGVTGSGRTVVMEKSDPLNYPELLKPGDERSVLLLAPSGFALRDVARIQATINYGKTLLTLRLVVPRGAVTGTPYTVPPPARPSAPMVDDAAAARSLGPTGVTEAPLGTIPVIVEIEQPMGRLLRVEVQWDSAGEPLVLSPDGRQTFYIDPGPHELHLVSRMPGIAVTEAYLPVMVSLQPATRVTIEVTPRLTGVDMTVRIWRGGTLIATETFRPTTPG